MPAHGQVPRTVYLAPAPEPRRWRPPPPTVEDEVESLAREHGSSTVSVVSDEEPQFKGAVNQEPMMVEVHEYNPERRFVIVPENAPKQGSSRKDKPKTEKRDDREDVRDRSSVRRTPKPEEDYKRQRDTGESSRYGLERRKSQQELPPIETELDDHRHPQHHRTQSAVNGPRPDYFDSRQSRPYGDSLLSPEIIQGGPKGREKRYQGMGQSSGGYHGRSPSRSSQYVEPSRDSERDRYGRDRASSSARRSTTDVDSNRPRRRMTNDADPRYRDEYLYPKGEKRDTSSYGRPDGPRVKLSPRSSRDPSRSGDEYSRSPRSSGYLSSKPVIVQDEKPPSARPDRKDDVPGHMRSSSRTSTFPLMAAAATAATAAASQMAYDNSRNTPREPVIKTPRVATSTPRESNTQLPYPDDDFPPGVGLGIQGGDAEARHPKLADIAAVSMPEPSPTVSTAPGRPFDLPKAAPATPLSTAPTPQAWQPPAFDPEKDGAQVERPVGSYRRYSESHPKDPNDSLPECPRQKPTAGKVDWLTLPHTNFNICPTCYDSVFSKTEYRTFFKPMLRPSDEAIACDFGVSPWYRIAWLLTVKDEVPDLRLLQQLATICSAPNREPCPGSKKATRTWLTVKDPHTRQPVADFSVCYQCARSVELLLPNLTGVFVPIDARPNQDICSLHFTPERQQFVLFFDALETTSDKALEAKQPPNVDDLARELWYLTVGSKCREDTQVLDGYWHTMQFLPQFTVCSNCFQDVVKPKLGDGNVIARNFYMKAQRLPTATCQLYSGRMREIFKRSCRKNDPKYLEEKVVQRRRIEKDIYEKLVKLDRANVSSTWKEEQVETLVEEWKRWE